MDAKEKARVAKELGIKNMKWERTITEQGDRHLETDYRCERCFEWSGPGDDYMTVDYMLPDGTFAMAHVECGESAGWTRA